MKWTDFLPACHGFFLSDSLMLVYTQHPSKHQHFWGDFGNCGIKKLVEIFGEFLATLLRPLSPNFRKNRYPFIIKKRDFLTAADDVFAHHNFHSVYRISFVKFQYLFSVVFQNVLIFCPRVRLLWSFIFSLILRLSSWCLQSLN